MSSTPAPTVHLHPRVSLPALWPGALALGVLLACSALAVGTHRRKGGSAIS